MTLEHRVLVVEQELQILKSQIQITLLTIQEHLLTNTYPALRVKDARVNTQANPEEERLIAQSSSVKRISISEKEHITDTAAQESPSLPAAQVQRVQAVQSNHNAPRYAEPYPQTPSNTSQASQSSAQNDLVSTSAPPSFNESQHMHRDERGQRQQERSQAADVRLWIELDQWVEQKVKEVGIRRTRELISLFEGPEHDLLMHVLEIYEQQPEIVRPRSVPRPRPVANTSSPAHSVAEEWQKFASTSNVRNASYRPFGEHQELALRLIADILSASQPEPSTPQSNSLSNH